MLRIYNNRFRARNRFTLRFSFFFPILFFPSSFLCRSRPTAHNCTRYIHVHYIIIIRVQTETRALKHEIRFRSSLFARRPRWPCRRRWCRSRAPSERQCERRGERERETEKRILYILSTSRPLGASCRRIHTCILYFPRDVYTRRIIIMYVRIFIFFRSQKKFFPYAHHNTMSDDHHRGYLPRDTWSKTAMTQSVYTWKFQSA